MTRNLLIILMTLLACLGCDTADNAETQPKKNQEVQNDFPIVFLERKILEFNKPFISPRGGQPIKEDTFSVYTLSNRTDDNVWVMTIKHSYDEFTFKDTSIKNIYIGGNRTFHDKETNNWKTSFIDDCCLDSVKLVPNQSTYFILYDGGKRYDSISQRIVVKVKDGKTFKELRIPKKFILAKSGEYLEDSNSWTYP